MITPLKTKIYISFFLLLAFLILPDEAFTQRRRRGAMPVDTLQTDTLKGDSLKNGRATKKQPLEAPVVYEANDSIVFTQGGYAHLYGAGKVNYEKIELLSDIITMNMDSSTVYARGVIDSVGVAKGTPVFKDGETPYESKAMRYNFKSKKGFISNVVTQQGEGYVTSRDAKKGSNDDLFMQNGKYTTCDNHEHPHFYLELTRAKVKPKKNVVFGPAYLVVEDVPLPIAIPFGFFPFTSSYSSGFIMPTYGDEMSRGFYLRDGGYYFAISDRMDLKLTGEIFTKGSWGLSAETSYNKRYRYSGSFLASYQVTKTGDKNMPDYAVSKDFKINWSHRQDTKASPNSTFSASVNFATSSYEKTNLTSYYDPSLYSQNTKTSSVSYSRSFPDQKLTLSSTFNLAQRTKDSTISVTLPDLNIALSSFYPFKRKKAVGEERWYEKISMSYTGQIRNSITTKEDKFFKSNIIKDWTNGVNHQIPISATFTLFKYLNVTPSFNYTERWYSYKVKRSWDDNLQEVKRDTTYGFNRVYNYNASLGISTKLYGFYKPIKAIFGDKIQAIRHVFTPQISFSSQPDFGASRYGYWDSYISTNSEGKRDTVSYSPYEGAIFGVPGKGKQGSISLDVSNNLEMKIKSDRDSTGVRKISLIDELGAGISYNMAAETRPWSDLSMRLRLKFSKSYTLNLSTSFATYAYQFDSEGNVVVGDRTEWSYGRFGRFQGSGTSFSYTFNNDTWKKWFGPKEDDKKDAKKKPDEVKDTDQNNESTNTKKTETKKAELDEDGYMAFKMPWSFNLSYSFNLRENTAAKINEKSMRYPYKLTHTMSGSGNVKISNRWNFTYSGSYDFDAHKIAQTTCTITRDLHCWSMSCSLSPFGTYRSYNFSIRANSSMLQDLKWEQRSSSNSNIKWY